MTESELRSKIGRISRRGLESMIRLFWMELHTEWAERENRYPRWGHRTVVDKSIEGSDFISYVTGLLDDEGLSPPTEEVDFDG